MYVVLVRLAPWSSMATPNRKTRTNRPTQSSERDTERVNSRALVRVVTGVVMNAGEPVIGNTLTARDGGLRDPAGRSGSWHDPYLQRLRYFVEPRDQGLLGHAAESRLEPGYM